jgi:hypothetical protein
VPSLLFYDDFVLEKSIDVVALANLIVVVTLTLAIPIVVHPFTDAAKLRKELLIQEINRYLAEVDAARDWVCELQFAELSEEKHKRTLFYFKKLRQKLIVLEREIKRTTNPDVLLNRISNKLDEFWASATDDLVVGARLPSSYAIKNIVSTSNLQLALNELRHSIKA